LVCSARKLCPVISTKGAPWVRRSRAAETSNGSPNSSAHSARSRFAGQQDRAAFVSFVDDVVEILGTRRAQRLEPEVVEDEEMGGIASEAGVARRVGAAPRQVGEHLVGAHEEDLVAAATGFVRQGLGEVALADAGRNSHMLRSFNAASLSITAGIRSSAKR
jgi:hypothetical protein